MEQQNYNCRITAKISPSEAFGGINRVSEWWTENLEGNSNNLDDVFTVTFGETFATLKIIEFEPNKKVVWLVSDCNLQWLKDKKEWVNTKLIWEISTENNATQISMTHLGLVPTVECYSDCEKGWNFYIKESLFKLLTEQKGVPDKIKTAPVENN
ncbi:MAG: hypothetical protein JWP44_2916 [Mucilaginibacter sp.]|nr:hypothetical protein [Mucilaginibacter sp.]